jgi:hypothetical protein
MNDSTSQALEQAYELVEAGRPDEAAALLKPILDSEPENVDAWWIYIHATNDPQEARRALAVVQRLEPDYAGVSELMATLDEKFPAPRILPVEMPVEVPVEAPASMPEAPASIPEPAPVAAPRLERAAAAVSSAPAPRPAPQRQRSSLPLIALIVVVVVFVLAVLLLSNRDGGEITTPTAIAQSVDATATPGIIAPDVTTEATSETFATEEVLGTPEASSDVNAVEQTPAVESSPEAAPVIDVSPTPETFAPDETAEATDDASAGGTDFSALDMVLSRYTLPENGVIEAETTLGNTLIVQICSAPGREMRTRAPEVLTLVSRESPALVGSIDALAARMVNCETGDAMLTLGVDKASADAYAQGQLSAREFEALWQPF